MRWATEAEGGGDTTKVPGDDCKAASGGPWNAEASCGCSVKTRGINVAAVSARDGATDDDSEAFHSGRAAACDAPGATPVEQPDDGDTKVELISTSATEIHESNAAETAG